MGNFNQWVGLGRLTTKPELKDVGTSKVARFAIAVNYSYTKGEERVEETDFINVEAWGANAALLSKMTDKGKELFITGRLKTDTWEDKDTGKKQYKTYVKMDNFQFVGAREGSAPPKPNNKTVLQNKSTKSQQDEEIEDIPF